MSTKGNANQRKGAETERMAAKYLKTWWPEVDRRLREGRADDQGDLDGVPYACTQVKYWETPRLQEWVTKTLKQRDTRGCPLVWIVSHVKYRPIDRWDAYMPVTQIHGGVGMDESEATSWVRMDFRLAVEVMWNLIQDVKCYPSLPS